jgi:Spy/CpxP family protein refolding chaperone
MTAAGMQAPWQNKRVLSTLAMVFLAGAASGALSMQFGLHGWLHRTLSTPEPTPKPRETLIERFNSELDLTPDQSQKISVVLADWTGYYQSLQEQLDDLRATGRQQILEVLTPDQRQKFEKIAPDLDVPVQ